MCSVLIVEGRPAARSGASRYVFATSLLFGLWLCSGCSTVGVYERMSEDDRHLAQTALQDTLEGELSGTTKRWNNPTTGYYGTVTPKRTYRSKTGFYCREYIETLSAGDETQTYTQTACRDRDGIWKLI